jgi:two-component system, OmpR family, KDP operon response regulator KdpE
LQGKRILIIDDHAPMREGIRRIFEKEGAMVSGAAGGEEGLRLMAETHPDLILLDVLMPGKDGWQTLQEIRQSSDVAVIMLSALAGVDDVLRGLAFGADDYIGKPFESSLLLARARALLRRTGSAGRQGVYADDHLSVNLSQRRICVAGKAVSLTPRELDLLAYLLRNEGRVRTYEQILTAVWGDAASYGREAVHVYIWQLRRKIEADPKQPRYIHTVHRVGYVFQRQV